MSDKVQVLIFSGKNPSGPAIAVLDGVLNPSVMEELKNPGAGDLDVHIDDPKIVNDPTILAYRNIAKLKVGDRIVGATVISKKTADFIQTRPDRRVIKFSGEGLRGWLNDAVVYPDGGLRSNSYEERYFSFSSPRGSWYNEAQWTEPFKVARWGDVPTSPWRYAPREWPDVPDAFWVWSQNSIPSAPAGDNYFRFEFNAPQAAKYAFFLAGDDTYFAYVDGQLLAQSEPDSAAWVDMARIDVDLEAGDHVFSVKVTNRGGPAALIAAVFTYGDPDVPSSAQIVSFTGIGTAAYRQTQLDAALSTEESRRLAWVAATGNAKTVALRNYQAAQRESARQLSLRDLVQAQETAGFGGWVCAGYPDPVPGWTPGEIMLTLLEEAKARGVRFPTYLTPQFSALTDSNGAPWERGLDWRFRLGTPYSEVVERLEELSCDLWIDPDTYDLYLYGERGVDRSVPQYDVDGITILEGPIIFEQGKNLLAARVDGVGEIKNSLMVQTNDGWRTAGTTDTQSLADYGVVEGLIETGASEQVAEVFAKTIFRLKETPEEGATYTIVPTPGHIPFVDFNVGDWVLAPNERNVPTRRRVVSLAVEADDAGNPIYAVEFDTIFQDNEDRLSRWMEKASGGALGGQFSNGGGSSSPIGVPVVRPPSTTPIRLPRAPTDLVVTSVGVWSVNGVRATAEATFSWSAVTSNTDGSFADPDFYEVWGRPTALEDGDSFQLVASSFTNGATVGGFETNSEWQFKVRAVNRATAVGDFSDIFTHTMDSPSDPTSPPDAPSLSSDKGVLIVTWNGLLGGLNPPAQFRYLYAEVATASGGPYTRRGTTLARDGRNIYISGLDVGTTYWVRLVAVDGLGLASAPSTSASHTLTGIQGPDIQPGTVTFAELDTVISDAIQDAQNDAANAVTAANGKNKVWYQDAEPTGTHVEGDTWFDTNDGNRIYRWNGTAWVPAALGSNAISSGAITSTQLASAVNAAISDASADASAALTAANGKNKVWYQTAAPSGTGHTVGDTWFDTDDGNRIYVWNGTIWADAQDAAIASAAAAASAAQGAASAAQTTANGKNRVVRSASDASSPTSYAAGDQWWKYSGSQIVGLWIHDGSAWVQQTLTDAVITNLDAGTITAGTLSADRIAANSLSIGKVSGLQTTLDAKETPAGAQEKASAAQTAATNAALIADAVKPGTGGVKTFARPLIWSSRTNGGAGSIVIKTPITMSNYMLTMSIRGYNYHPSNGQVVDITLGGYFYNIGPTFINTYQASYGSLPITARLAWTAAGTAVIILDNPAGVWHFPNLEVVEVVIGFTTPPDSFKDGWTAAIETDLTPYLGTMTPPRRDFTENHDVTLSWRSTGTTTIDGGKITADSVTAGALKAWTVQAGQAMIADGTITNAKIANLDAAKITAGTLSADRIGARTITADKILVGDFTNLAADGNFLDPAMGNWSGTGVHVANTGAPNHVRLSASETTNTGCLNSNSFQVAAGERIYMEAWVYGETTNVGGGGPALCLRVLLNTGGFAWPLFSTTREAVHGAWTKVSGSVVVPNNAVRGDVQLLVLRASEPAGTGGNVYLFREVVARRMASGELIVDGAITAAKMVAGTITAASGIIADAAITNAKIANLDAAKITTGTLSADRIGANTISVSKLLVSNNTENLLEDPGFEANSTIAWSNGNASVTKSTENPRTGSRCLRMATTGVAYEASRHAQAFPVEEGERYVFGAWARIPSGGAFSDGAVELSIAYGATEATTTTTVAITDSSLLDATYRYIQGQWTVPAGVRFFRPRIVIRDTTASRVYYVDDVSLYRAVSGELIVDGTITGNKIQAGSILAENLAAGSVTANAIASGSVESDSIAANAITAEKIDAAAITANKIASGAIETYHLSAAVGAELDISSNAAVNIIVGQVAAVSDQATSTSNDLSELKTYYTFGPNGASITKPESAYALNLTNEGITITEGGTEVSRWDAGQLIVESLVSKSVNLGNHKIERDGTRTVMRAL